MAERRHESEESRIHIEGLKPADIALLKTVASEAAHAAVHETLIAMGIDPDNPMDAQRDMVWLRATRERCESTAGRAFAAIIVLILGSIGTAIVVGARSILSSGPHP